MQAAWYSLCLIAAGLVVARADACQHAMRILHIGALLTALWTLAQFYGFEPVSLISPTLQLQTYNPQHIAYGPLALTGLTAGYLAVALVVYIILQKKLTWYAVLHVSIVASTVIATGNRTAPAAVVIVLVVWTLLHALRRNTTQVRIIPFFFLFIFLSVTLMQTTRSQVPEQLVRTQDFVQGQDTSWQLRRILWQTATLGIFDHPLTGLGTRGFGGVFWSYLTSAQRDTVADIKLPDEARNVRYLGGSLFTYQIPEQEEDIFYSVLIDKAHNYALDFIIANGWLAALLFTVSLVSGAMLLSLGDTNAKAVALGMGVYLLFGLTWFATLLVDPIIWGLFGVGIGSALRAASYIPAAAPSTFTESSSL
ncbi:MAG: O-antigen ligase family protein [Deinococcota bacterium]